MTTHHKPEHAVPDSIVAACGSADRLANVVRIGTGGGPFGGPDVWAYRDLTIRLEQRVATPSVYEPGESVVSSPTVTDFYRATVERDPGRIPKKKMIAVIETRPVETADPRLVHAAPRLISSRAHNEIGHRCGFAFACDFVDALGALYTVRGTPGRLERRVRVPFGGDRRNLASVVALAAGRAVGDAWRAPGVVEREGAARCS